MPFDHVNNNTKWYYSECFTIDPTKGAAAWEKLSANQFGLEIGMLPQHLHFSLIDTLKERKTFERLGGRQAAKRRAVRA